MGVAAWAFYQAEKGVNPKIKAYIDSFYYISTCASVGYADVFAVTQPGKTITAIVMMIGPSLTGRALNTPESR
ncbi:MAG: ion channel [Anaerolineales bacterium]